ncbi:DUF6886 family protein [Paenibacillus sp. BC26]|uniref:DUF6886 family protein n=1 Tax=Paenibacillus sp. BC26 TaxID=1881032 RepID=UPI0008F06420|nr:DUF6886 family protein [Paenibacillus sp. BC26]SFS72489.1 hypothetical protein SAMN05428962_2483 [Paenibacillus sp. BC26]
MKLYHFSEEPDIKVFEPRPLYKQTDAKVWTIDEYHAPHYYFPRECPRVCVWPKKDTNEIDREKFFGMSKTNRMVAIESGWYNRLRKGHVYRYTFDSDGFELTDSNAGYYISTRAVVPENVEIIDDLLSAIIEEGIEIRVTPSLLPLKERIVASTVNFSMIRMRNAILE